MLNFTEIIRAKACELADSQCVCGCADSRDKVGSIASSHIVNDTKTDCPLSSPSFFIPALADLHVHFREPGYESKETILTGSMAAEAAGYGLVCTMPNLNPAPDCLENLKVQLDKIERDARVRVLPYGCITKGRAGKKPAEYEEMMPYVAGFSDDGSGVEDDDLMEECMRRIASLGGLIVAHCEKGKGNDREREYTEVERNIRLAKKTGCRLHLCHISTKESLYYIRKGKADGVKLTCETAPHYLLFSRPVLNSGAFRMNPPIGEEADQKALIAALIDGTIDVIATDHAPHTKAEKSRGFMESACGIVGLESALPVIYTFFVRTGIISMERMIDLMSRNAYRILGITQPPYYIKVDFATPFTLDATTFKSKGHSCPFDGMELYGKVLRL